MKLEPPCRVFLANTTNSFKESATFDVLQVSKTDHLILKLVNSEPEQISNPVGIFIQELRKLGDTESLQRPLSELNETMLEFEANGWNVRVLPFEKNLF